MNYSALSAEELIARAESDPGARAYVGENIYRIWSDAVDDTEAMQEVYEKGREDERYWLLETYGEDIAQMVQKYDEDPGDEHHELVRLLNAIWFEFNGGQDP